MKISLSELRALIKEAIADTMMAPTEAPPASQAQIKGANHPAIRSNTPASTKANQVAKIVNQRTGDTSLTQSVQKYVSSLDPQDQLVKTAEQIAQEFLISMNRL